MPSWPMPRLAPTTRAALWILLSGICAVMMNVLIRIAAQSMHPFEVAFFRCFFGLVLVLPWIIKGGPGLLRSRNAGFYLLRGAVGLVSMVTWFYGITIVPLATATAVNFTAPLFATIAAAFVLHEDVRLRRWSAVVIGFVGVMGTTKGAFYGYGGFGFDINIVEKWVITPTAAVGYFEHGTGINLGAHTEFRTGAEFGYRFDNLTRLGAGFYHMSNAGIGKKNPGVELATLVFTVPLQ